MIPTGMISMMRNRWTLPDWSDPDYDDDGDDDGRDEPPEPDEEDEGPVLSHGGSPHARSL